MMLEEGRGGEEDKVEQEEWNILELFLSLKVFVGFFLKLCDPEFLPYWGL
jgi:hypothetical protein